MFDADGHTDVVRRAFFMPDGQQVVSVSLDKSIRIWDVATGETIRVLRPPIGRGIRGALRAAALSHDGTLLAVTGQRADPSLNVGPIYLVNLTTERIERVFQGHDDAVVALAISRDKRKLAAGDGRKMRVWDLASGKLEQTLGAFERQIMEVAFSPDSQLLAAASQDGNAEIWYLAKGVRSAQLIRHTKSVNCISWSPDGLLIATGSADGFVRLYPTPLRQVYGAVSPRRTVLAHPAKAEVTAVSFSPDGKEVLATGTIVAQRGAVVSIPVVGDQVRIFPSPHTNTVMHGTLSADGQQAVTTGGNDHETFIWRMQDGTVTQKLRGKGRSVWGVGWSADGQSIAWGNVNRGTTEFGTPLERSFRLSDLEFGALPDGNYLRAIRSNAAWSLEVVDNDQLVIKGRDGAVNRFRTDGERINSFTLLGNDKAVVGGDLLMYLVELRTGKQLRYFAGHAANVFSLCPSPDGRYFVSGSADQTMRVWDPERQEPLVSLFVAGSEWIAWTPEGYYAASAGGERLMGWQLNHG
ncbi:MAG: WD40 repeat domain-containing protein, partial [Planctomycetia bacterium]|nr:WD40 repeat domain-containing protein [Planctomycetia bacterium]